MENKGLNQLLNEYDSQDAEPQDVCEARGCDEDDCSLCTCCTVMSCGACCDGLDLC